jgi:hypothetical protein
VKPLQSIAMGLVIVALSARVHGYDVLADPVGWLLVLLGVGRLVPDLPFRGAVRGLAVLATVVSVPLFFPGVVDALADADDSLVWAANLPQVAFVALLCHVLAAAAGRAGDTGAARWLAIARTLTIVAGLLPVLVDTVATAWAGPMLLLALVALVVAIVLLFQYSGRPWAAAGEQREPDPA